MEKRSRRDVASRFAEGLVAQMLQRSGTTFFQVRDSSEDAADFVVQVGGKVYIVEVKYADKPMQAETLWKHWTGGRNTTCAASQVPSWTEKIPYCDNETKTLPKHLVVVTGNGDRVYTDTALAPMLVTDNRTTLSVLE